FGYAGVGHLDYMRYVQQRHAFPLVSDGWEMYQPPLYYLLCAGLLQMLSLTVDQSAGIAALRLLGLGIGVAHFTLVWASLRLLFPGEGARQRTGLLLAAFSPPLLYIFQYVTNDTLCAALSTACVYLLLPSLKTEQ